MSSDSLAALRRNVGPELAGLAEEHLQHDLQQSDRDTLRSAASSISTHTTIGSVVGLSLGIFLAVRLRRTRAQYFAAFRAAEKPTHVRFASGREEALPDLTPMMRPSTLGDVATALLFGAGGLFLGGETGVLTGSWRASSALQQDQESKKRIETAFRRFRADVLRREITQLEKGEKNALDL